MGRKSKKGNANKQGDIQPSKKVKTNDWQEDKRGKKDIFLTQFSNVMFKRFYELQLLDPYFKNDQTEFDRFWDSLSQPLPVSFRINPTQRNHESLIKRLQSGELVKELVDLDTNVRLENIIGPVEWYPNNLAWEAKLAKKELRKAMQLSQLHSFIQKCNSTGLLTRQEVVSMLPPLFLNPKKGEYVLDMCAAPGSKTCQMLEMMEGDTGCLVANDVDQKRAYMLSHQLKRMPTAPVVITNHAAQFFPTLQHQGRRILFDKILCDVPCTGDGAARKLPTRWLNWSARDGNAIHPLQLSILMRALNLCKVGGLVLYSTCSLNPIEDEAVVTEIFRRVQKDSLELIELNTIEKLKTRPGLPHWKVLTTDDVLHKEYCVHLHQQSQTGEQPQQPQKQQEEEEQGKYPPQDYNEFFKSLTPSDFIHELKNVDDVPKLEHIIGKYSRKQAAKYAGQFQGIRPSLFPADAAFMDEIGISRTIRIMPHDQDTGGFYLALFRKKSPLLWTRPQYSEQILGTEKYQQVQQQQQQKATQQQQADEAVEDLQVYQLPHEQSDQKDLERILNRNEEEAPPPKSKTNTIIVEKKQKPEKIEEYVPIHDYDWNVFKEYYGISEDFPREQLHCSSGDPIFNPSKKFRFISKEVKNLMDHDPQKHLKCLNLGCKIMERGKESFGGSVAPYKLCQEGLQYLLPYLTKRVLSTSRDTFLFLIERKNIKDSQLEDQELLKNIQEVGQGCFVLRIKEDDGSLGDSVVVQYFKNSISLMCTAETSQNFLIRHGRM